LRSQRPPDSHCAMADQFAEVCTEEMVGLAGAAAGAAGRSFSPNEAGWFARRAARTRSRRWRSKDLMSRTSRAGVSDPSLLRASGEAEAECWRIDESMVATEAHAAPEMRVTIMTRTSENVKRGPNVCCDFLYILNCSPRYQGRSQGASAVGAIGQRVVAVTSCVNETVTIRMRTWGSHEGVAD
jgi:hypothetical protein